MTESQGCLAGRMFPGRTGRNGKDIGTLQDELCGALIGVARASESNPLVNDGTYEILLGGLAAAGACGDKDDAVSLRDAGTSEENVLRVWTLKAREERHRLVPKCSSCANPCGRTEEYDIRNARLTEPAGLVRKKEDLLKELAGLAGIVMKDGRTGEIDGFFAWALFEVGYEETEEGMQEVITALDSVRASVNRWT